MDSNLKIKVGLDSLQKAKSYLKDCNYGRAFAHYLVFFELIDYSRKKYEKQFTETLCIWGKLLEQRNQVEDLCKCYLQALNYFPLNVKILNNFGAHLIRIDEYEEAKKCLQLAHNLSPNFLPAEKHLMTVKGELIERWHFPMLNDSERNMAYYKAILSYTAESNAKIIDIGTGCGLLSLFASNNENIASIYAIEGSRTISSIAIDIFLENNMTKIKLFNKHSTELNSNDVNGSGNLLITEIFDVGLFGENAIATLIHAKENLLDKNAKIIPSSASLYVCGIECLDILKSHKLVNKYEDLHMQNICAYRNVDEPYDSVNLKSLTYKQITETKCVLTADFSNLSQLKDLQFNLDGKYHTLKITSSGSLHAFAIWFDLHLDANNTITTNPLKENVKCWEQAITHIDHPAIYSADEDIQIKMQCHNGRLEISLVNEYIPCSNCFKISSEMITFLNDLVLISSLTKLHNSALNNKNILDMFPFPILGLKYAKSNKCHCVVKSESDRYFIQYVCNINNIPAENIIIMEEQILSNILTSKSTSFDIILLNPVCKSGIVNENLLLSYKYYQISLNPGGIIYPKEVNLYCQIIESDYLCNFNMVNDENLFGFHIASHINQYSVNEHFDLDKNFQHKKMSKPQCLGNIFVENSSKPDIKKIECQIQQCKTDGILYWFEYVFCDENIVSTASCTHYNYACFLMDRQKIKLENRSNMTLCVKQHRGLIKIYCET